MMVSQTAIHLLRFQRWLSLILVVILLAGCVRRTPNGSEATRVASSPLPGKTASPTSSAVQASPTLTLSMPPTTATATSTDLGPTPTPDLGLYNRQAWVESSPYGPWQAISVVAYPEAEDGSLLGDQYHVVVNLVHLETGTSSPLLNEWRPYGLGYTVPQVFNWSNDGQYMFLAETGNADGSGERFYQDIQRLNLQTGVLSHLDLPGGTSVSISPSGSRLAHIDGDKLVLIDIETSEEEEIRFELPRVESRPGQIFWSPESHQILFSLRLNPFNPVEEMSSSIFLANLEEGQIKTLVEADRRRFSIRSFPSEATALLADLEAREWWLALPGGAIRSDPPDEIGQASQAVQSYFNTLQTGRYEDAARWYGGSYETLQAMNPDIPADDQAGLLARACTVNGFACLAIDSLLLEQITADGNYLFQVSFKDSESNLFILNPCCGADLELQPPVWLFRFSVQRADHGRYQVMELPVYTP